jgi:hypothetical protein
MLAMARANMTIRILAEPDDSTELFDRPFQVLNRVLCLNLRT